jgi:hypothetical protein
MFDPGGIKDPVQRYASFKLPDAISFTSTKTFDCMRFETDTPITVVVVAEWCLVNGCFCCTYGT